MSELGEKITDALYFLKLARRDIDSGNEALALAKVRLAQAELPAQEQEEETQG